MNTPREPLLLLRTMLAISSLSPLFVLVAIKGSELVCPLYLMIGCFAAIAIPVFFIYIRISRANSNNDKVTLSISIVEDSRDHLLVYLFSVLVPLFQSNLDTYRGVALFLVVFMLVTYLFVHLRLYYTNIIFALFGYKLFSLVLQEGARVVLLSKKESIIETKISALRVTNFLYIDEGK